MMLTVENSKPYEDATEKNLEKALRGLRSYGPRSFACLADADGSFIQVAGGLVTCMVEFKQAGTGKLLRAFHDKPSTPFPDGTKLVFGGGEIELRNDEWFNIDQVIPLFSDFLNHGRRPESVDWRDAGLEVEN